jgi:hypothetical protein
MKMLEPSSEEGRSVTLFFPTAEKDGGKKRRRRKAGIRIRVRIRIG